MARAGGSSKFVPVNLNKSYGQPSNSNSNSVVSGSASLSRSRSYGGSSHGGMVYLSRSTRVSSSSSSSSSVTVSAASPRVSKLTVPRPVNLPSLRREHAGNDPTVALVGGSGSSGWSKQVGSEEISDTGAVAVAGAGAGRSDCLTGESTWANNSQSKIAHAPVLDGASHVSGRPSVYTPPGSRNSMSNVPPSPAPVPLVEKAVVFRGEDFPTLQSAVVPSATISAPQQRPKDSLHKQRFEGSDQQKKSQQSSITLDSSYRLDPHVQVQGKATSSESVDNNHNRTEGWNSRGPSPLIQLSRTSNWGDDERETLSTFPSQERNQSEWNEQGDPGGWGADYNSDVGFRQPTSRGGYSGRNEADSVAHSGYGSKGAYGKDADNKIGFGNASRFDLDYRADTDRLGSAGRSDLLKRGWSFSAVESGSSRDGRYWAPENNNGRETNTRTHFRAGNVARPDAPGWETSTRDMGQGQDYRSVKGAFPAKQGFNGRLMQGDKGGRSNGYLYAGADGSGFRKSNPGTLGRNEQTGLDYMREKKANAFPAQLHNDDPFLGDIISTRSGSFLSHLGADTKLSKVKKETIKDDDLRDPAREHFEAELERVQKMLELERHRAIEEQERAVELARKEQEEQERIAREEEELRLKLEEEAREAAARAQREAEEVARKTEELRKAREDEKRMMAFEEERRKEAARKKLLALEEKIAKREHERKNDDGTQKDRCHTIVQPTLEVSMPSGDSGRRNIETNDRDRQGHFISGFKKVDQDEHDFTGSRVGTTDPSLLPSLLESPSSSSYLKEDNAFSMRRHRPSPAWKRESIENGPGLRGIQKGSPRNLYSPDDSHPVDYELKPNAEAPRNPSLADTDDRVSLNNFNDRDSGNWWNRDVPNRSESPLGNYFHAAEGSEYPPYGRLRQSLPKQPRVLPPPPRKAVVQIDGPKSTASGTDLDGSEITMKQSEDFTHRKDHEFDISNGKSISVPKQFEPTPSEEVVLSDAVSQFSDDTIEDVPTPAAQSYQEQDLHSDAVSDTYSEEADEISDLTDAQESSEEAEAQVSVPDMETSKGDEILGTGNDGNVVISKNDQDDFQTVQTDVKLGYSEIGNDVEMVAKDERPAAEDSAAPDKDSRISILHGSKHEGEAYEHGAEEARTVLEAKPVDKNSTLERAVQESVVQPLLHQVPFLPAGSVDVTQMGHSEGIASRQSLVQQFQQPFSFMAVPLPQPGNLNNVGANPSMLSSLHGLQNQQELPFHLQLGLLPGVPLLPNAIQIGSIQMPLHIHPQIPQFGHLHGQQAPVFQFGQIGHSVPITQPSAIVQPNLQVHHALGQTIVPHQHQSAAEPFGCMDVPSGSLNSEKMEIDAVVQNTAGKISDIVSKTIESSQPCAKVSEGSGSKVSVKDLASDVLHEEITAPKVEISSDHLRQQISDSNYSSHEQNPDAASSQPHQNIEFGGRSSRGRRRSNAPRYRGILGRGRGRFHGAQNYSYPVYHATAETWSEGGVKTAETWSEGGVKRVARGRVYHRNSRRTEYKVRSRIPPPEDQSAATEMLQSSIVTHSGVVESREREEHKNAKETTNNFSDLSRQTLHANSRSKHVASKEDRPGIQNGRAVAAGPKGLPKKYETDATGDAPLRSGVVCVFEQPGIETQNDKDDFIKVRSKRQLLREQREQREKENKTKSMDSGSREQHFKRSSMKGVSDAPSVGNANKNNVKRKARGNEVSGGNRQMVSNVVRTAQMSGTTFQTVPAAASAPTTATNESHPKKSSVSQKPVLSSTTSSAVHVESGMPNRFPNDGHSSEQPMTVAWGGQRSNQEVVSFTQIQLEEAMKPFRAESSFKEPLRPSERSMLTLEPRISPALASENLAASVKAPGPISSLFAGEKIQFGAVTSPPFVPAGSSPQSPRTIIRIGSPLGLMSGASHVPCNAVRSVSNFLESDRDATFTLNDKHLSEDAALQGKVADLEAEAEAAASAVAAAAIGNEDPMESHRNTRVSVLDGSETASVARSNPHSMGNSGLPITRPGITQLAPNNGLTDNATSVSLPADLSVDMPPTLFQGNLPASSGVMLQSLPNGAAPFPCLEMGPMLGGPIFTFGPREDASFTSLEPGLTGWQQRHLGAPDSFYGAAQPFMSPTGLPGIQGHPHMLVYTNPFTPVGQFGQLGVSFMGAAYHTSGKQPDWTHVPLPSSSSGMLGLNDVDINSGPNGVMPSRHNNVASMPNPSQQTTVTGSTVLPVAASSAVFDSGLSIPFQSHWSKAPAPPATNASISAPQNVSMSGPAVGFNIMQSHQSRAITNQLGHVSNLLAVSGGFSQLPVLKPATGSTFSSANCSAQFPDELGLGDSVSSRNVLNDAGGSLSGGHGSNASSIGVSDRKLQHAHHVSHSSHGQFTGVNSKNNIELAFLTNLQDNRDLVGSLKSQKAVSRMGSSARRAVTSSFPEHKSSSQVSASDSVRTEWSAGTHRRGSGRFSADRANSGQSSKFKQIYVAKSTAVPPKVSGSADASYRV